MFGEVVLRRSARTKQRTLAGLKIEHEQRVSVPAAARDDRAPVDDRGVLPFGVELAKEKFPPIHLPVRDLDELDPHSIPSPRARLASI